MKWDQITIERALIALILFPCGGGAPASTWEACRYQDGEAGWALQSLSIARGAAAEIGRSPGCHPDWAGVFIIRKQ